MYTKPTDSAVDQLAHILSEIMNDAAPIGWERYRFPAGLLLSNKQVLELMLAERKRDASVQA